MVASVCLSSIAPLQSGYIVTVTWHLNSIIVKIVTLINDHIDLDHHHQHDYDDHHDLDDHHGHHGHHDLDDHGNCDDDTI